MPFVITQPTSSRLSPGPFLERFSCASNWERDRITEVVKFAKKNEIRITLISDTAGNDHGFIALSLIQLNKRFALRVDFLFTSTQYRGICYDELEGKRISDFFLGFSIEAAITANKVFPIKYIVLQPANEPLKHFYNERGFREIDATDWLYFNIPLPGRGIPAFPLR